MIFSTIKRHVGITLPDLCDLRRVFFGWISGRERDDVSNFRRGAIRDVLCGKQPFRLFQRGSFSFLEEDNIRDNIRPGVGPEGVVGQTDRAE